MIFGMQNMTNKNRKIIFGLGNTLNRDEGMGVYAVKALEKRVNQRLSSELNKGSINTEIEFLDGGVLGLNLLPWVEEASHLLILDAINANVEPGTLIEMKKDDILLYQGIKLSDHQITFQEVLGLAKVRMRLPDHLYLIGAQPVDISIGVDLSPQISSVLPKILDRAELILQEWGLIHYYD
jgi:hydrogenase maturation protease